MVIPSNQTSYLSLKLYHIFILKLYCIPFTAICFFFFFFFLRLRIRVCYCNVILLLLLFSALDSVFIHLPIVLIAEKEMAFRSSRVGIPSSVSSEQRNKGKNFNKILVEKFLITFRLVIRLFILHFLFESNNSFSKKNSGKNKKARRGGRERRHKRTLDTF